MTAVPIVDARRAVDALAKAQQQLRDNSFHPPGDRPAAEPKKRLVIKRNLEDVDYTEARAEFLQMPSDREPLLPQTLRPEIELKPHQRVGVAWLQHLWEASPTRNRHGAGRRHGTGEDTSITHLHHQLFRDRSDAASPALVVAPCCPTENWRNELDRFFQPGTLPLLMLYGSTLKSMRVGRHELDADLKAQGVTRLLNSGLGWRCTPGAHHLRNDARPEFALASQTWSVMVVCDEAQKIKTPAALVDTVGKEAEGALSVSACNNPGGEHAG